MTGDPAALLELLRGKAMLLLRRERELYELRQERRRIEHWLTVFHKLSLDHQVEKTAPLLGAWVGAMIGELSFQVAAVYARQPHEDALQLVSGMAHRTLPERLRLSTEARSFWRSTRSGRYSRRDPEALAELAEAAGLEMFLWHTFSSRDQELVLLAGFAEPSGGETVRDADLRQFTLLGHYLAALLNLALIAEQDAERFSAPPAALDVPLHLNRLRDAQGKLFQSTKTLTEVARRAGMADIATGVLHNVGNTLNSVNISAGLASERLRGMKIAGLNRLGDLLDQHAGDMASFWSEGNRQRTIPHYLRELAHHLTQERDAIATELRRLQEHIEHIKSIVNKQQSYASSVGLLEPCQPSQVMDDALALNEHSLLELGVDIVREYGEQPEILLDRHKVLQILVNLISNARHALVDSERHDKRLVAAVSASAGSVRLCVTDNGAGIAQEHLEKLFMHGFTTKRHGHGFGLHTSALAARQMGGSLRGESGGRGRGASFILELPIRVSQPMESAP